MRDSDQAGLPRIDRSAREQVKEVKSGVANVVDIVTRTAPASDPADFRIPGGLAKKLKPHLTKLGYAIEDDQLSRRGSLRKVTALRRNDRVVLAAYLPEELVEHYDLSGLGWFLPAGACVCVTSDRAEPPHFAAIFAMWDEDKKIKAKYVPREHLDADLEAADPLTALTARLRLTVPPEELIEGADVEPDDLDGAAEELLAEEPTVQPRKGVFVSYNRKDRPWLDHLKTMLAPIKDDIDLWDDSKIKAGEKWQEEIQRAMETAKVAVLLVSANFLDSDFIRDNELPKLLAAAQSRGLVIFWVAVSASLVENTPIWEFNAANDPKEPLDVIKDQGMGALNLALAAIAKQLAAAVEGSGGPGPTNGRQ